MKFASTRGHAPAVTISEAIRDGAAPDGGLYVPAEEAVLLTSGDEAGVISLLPARREGAGSGCVLGDSLPAGTHPPLAPPCIQGGESGTKLGANGPSPIPEATEFGDDLPSLAAVLLAPFFRGDPLEADLPAICAEAFDFPVPLVAPDPDDPQLRALELFHGPTGAFKDFGARFLMACFDRLGVEGRPLTVLAATSGDTGGAVGCAAEGRHSVRALILYPRGRVSPFQRLQLGCWRAPVTALEVEGDFDDCQRLVKTAFADADLAGPHRMTSANSINVGRLLPQMVYLAAAALRVRRETGVEPGFVIPTGNLGHAVAALWARRLGLPIGPVVAVTNANRTLSDWHRSGAYEPRPSVATIANAMDVGAPSNFERLARLPDPAAQLLSVERIEDEAIRARIATEHKRTGYVWDPHGATAAEAYARLDPARRQERVWIAAATAHPFKFAEEVEPLIGEKIAPPPALAAILDRRSHARRIPATLEALAEALDAPVEAETRAA